ncbi:MAG: argininosuccinate lyase [Candidatus Aenigmatarchaeota archaeon]
MTLWNGKAKNETARKVERFTASEDILLDQLIVKYDVIGTIAHLTMLNKIGVISKDELKRLKKALNEIIALDRKGKFKITPEEEDVHTKVETHLSKHLGEVGRKIHAGRSRNDQILLDMRLYTKEKMLDIEKNILDLCYSLVKFGKKNKDIPMPGYTHFRKAMPSSVGLWILSFAEALLDDLIMVKCAYKLNNQNPLGSAASYGVPLNIDRSFTTKLLGFEKVQNNVLYVANSRGKIESGVISALSQVMIDLSRLSTDLILFSADEFDFFEIPSEFCTGSSIMPKKRNPDVLELIRARGNKVFSFLFQMIGIVKDLPSGYNRDLQETKEPLMKSLNTVNACLDIMANLIDDLKVNEDKLIAAFTPEIFAADKAFELVSKGVPFRDAHKEIEYNFMKLDKIDPRESIKLKKHIGTTGNLGVNRLERQIVNEYRTLKSEKRAFAERINSLLA